MNQEKYNQLKEENEELLKKKERYKVIITAAITIFVCSLIAFLISVVFSYEGKLDSKDITYIFIMAVCLIIACVLIPNYIKIIRKFK